MSLASQPVSNSNVGFVEAVSGLGVFLTRVGRRKVNLPESGRWRAEFDRSVKPFGCFPRRASNLAIHPLPGPPVLQHQMSFGRQVLLHHHHRSLRSHAQRCGIQHRVLTLEGDMNARADAQQHALVSPAFGAGNGGFYGCRGCNGDCSRCGWSCCSDCWLWRRPGRFSSGYVQRGDFQRSTPQKLRSAASNSTPTSQPSDRSVPFHTTTPCAVSRVARFVTFTRSRSPISRGLTSRHP